MTDFFMNRKFMHIKGNNPNLNLPLFFNKQEHGYNVNGELADKEKQIFIPENSR